MMKIKSFLDASPLFAFYMANHWVLEPFQVKLMTHKVHFLQGLTLTCLLFEKKRVRPKDLISEFRVSASSLSHALRGLEKSGFLTREIHSDDARGYCFSLTPQGRKKALSLVKEFDATQRSLESSLGIKNLKELVVSVHQMIESIDQKTEKTK